MTKRSRGKKFPKGYIKTSIVLFLRQNSCSTTEIREHLKTTHNIAESRGIRLHLERLCSEGILDKTVRNGIGTHYFWKKDVESFRKIINMISQNGGMVRDILKQAYSGTARKTRHDTDLVNRIRDHMVPFDATTFWYNTEYTESFLTNDSIRYFVNDAYHKCSKNPVFVKFFSEKKIKPTIEMFRLILLEGLDDDTLRILMRHSPSLVLHVVNLQSVFETRVNSLDERKDLIFQMIVKDNLMGHHTPHGGGFFPVADIKKILGKDGKPERVDAEISYSFYEKYKEPLLITKRGGKTRK